MATSTCAVIENAAYEGENVRRDDFVSEDKAWKWARRHYNNTPRSTISTSRSRILPDGQRVYGD